MAIDERRARLILEQLAGDLGDELVLWRGDALDGSDVDLLVLPGAEGRLRTAMRGAGLVAGPGDPGHVVWSEPRERGLELDVLHSSAWPEHYPFLPGVVSRLSPATRLPPVPSSADRLLILAAEAVLGRPIDRIARRADSLLEESGASGSLAARATAEGEEVLGRLIARPQHLRGLARRGRLPYTRAAALALRSHAARAALRARARARLARALGPRMSARGRRAPGGAPLIALSGMDGAGKSTAALTVAASLRTSGWEDVVVSWGRLVDGDAGLLQRIAGPAKRIVRFQGRVADPVAAGAPRGDSASETAADGRRSPVAWTWILVVALVSARSSRRAALAGRRTTAVVCDRWLIDSLVDLEVRYGRHRVAEWALRRILPCPDLSVLLDVDPATAAARKPGDQHEEVLARMAAVYSRRSRELDLTRVDACRPREAVDQALRELLEQPTGVAIGHDGRP
ncbi:MAG: hypothetical protein ACR2NV_01500 [Thermoleophilaceae bacterium]